MRWVTIAVACGVALWAHAARAACGYVPVDEGANVAEVEQRAVVAFDGREEVLMLASQLRASAETKVLIITPLPSEPKVSAGSASAFTSAMQMIHAGLGRREAKVLAAATDDRPGQGGEADATPEPDAKAAAAAAASVVVVKAADRTTLADAMLAQLRQAGAAKPSLPSAITALTEAYLRDGFVWFALRVVALPKGETTTIAVRFRFATQRLFYPLRIDRGNAHATTIRLAMVSPRLLTMPDVGGPRVKLMHQPVPVNLSSLRNVDEQLAEFFGDRPDILLRLWEAKGRPIGFRADICTGWYQ